MLFSAVEFILHSSQSRGLFRWKCHTVSRLLAARILSSRRASYQRGRLILPLCSRSFLSGQGEQIWENRGGRKWSRLPQALLSNQNVIPPTRMKLNPTGRHKRLFHWEKKMFLGKQFKVGRCINTDYVCLTVPLWCLVMNVHQVEVNPSFVIITCAYC